MANNYIHVGSITNAMRGKALLEEQGIEIIEDSVDDIDDISSIVKIVEQV